MRRSNRQPSESEYWYPTLSPDETVWILHIFEASEKTPSGRRTLLTEQSFECQRKRCYLHGAALHNLHRFDKQGLADTLWLRFRLQVELVRESWRRNRFVYSTRKYIEPEQPNQALELARLAIPAHLHVTVEEEDLLGPTSSGEDEDDDGEEDENQRVYIIEDSSGEAEGPDDNEPPPRYTAIYPEEEQRASSPQDT